MFRFESTIKSKLTKEKSKIIEDILSIFSANNWENKIQN